LPGLPAREYARILFPRSCIARAREPFNRAMLVEREGGLVEVLVDEEHGSHDSQVMHTFGSNLHYLGAQLAALYIGRHQELYLSGLLDHPLDRKREEAELSRIRWLTRPPGAALNEPGS